MLKLLVINGPNLNMLGVRNKEIYGAMSLEQIIQAISKEAVSLSVEVDFYQSNIEGELVTKIQQALNIYSGIIINPGAYTHYSVAIRDALEAVGLPCIEVHISNIYAREEFRHKSVIVPVCTGQISGLGYKGYISALYGVVDYLRGV
ncbi:MAG: type II 3-dehydroquinate dehydratase [Clostridia bacterium]